MYYPVNLFDMQIHEAQTDMKEKTYSFQKT